MNTKFGFFESTFFLSHRLLQKLNRNKWRKKWRKKAEDGKELWGTSYTCQLVCPAHMCRAFPNREICPHPTFGSHVAHSCLLWKFKSAAIGFWKFEKMCPSTVPNVLVRSSLTLAFEFSNRLFSLRHATWPARLWGSKTPFCKNQVWITTNCKCTHNILHGRACQKGKHIWNVQNALYTKNIREGAIPLIVSKQILTTFEYFFQRSPII